MTRWGQRTSRNVLTVSFVLFSILWGGFLGAEQIAGLDPGIERFEALTADWRFLAVGARPAPPDVVIAGIDDETLRAAGAWPLPRGFVARIILGLQEHHPRAIAVDMLFLDPGPRDADLSLADALAHCRCVIAAAGLFDDTMPRGLIPRPEGLMLPTPVIGHSARVGLVNIATDRSGVPRHIPMIFNTNDGVLPSFVLAAASADHASATATGGDATNLQAKNIPLDLGFHLPVRFYGPRGSILSVSAASATGDDPAVDLVRDRVVVLGVTALGAGDMFATPFDRTVPGVEILATAIDNLLAHDELMRTPAIRRLDAAVMILLPVGVILSLAMRGAFVGVGVAAFLILAWLAATELAFARGYWLDVAGPLAVLAPVTLGYLAARTVLDRMIARRLTWEADVLARFQSPAMVRQLSRNPAFLEKPVTQDAAVVFLDLSGFTGVTEQLGAEATRTLLADFHTLIAREVEAHDGFVVSFMGDGAMILFGLPAPRQDDAARALRCAGALHASIGAWRDALPPATRDQISVRIGGHFGPVVASRLGPARHQHITATGDTVNVTSRLLEVAKTLSAPVVVSDDLHRAALAAGADEAALATFSPARAIAIRGRVKTLSVRTRSG